MDTPKEVSMELLLQLIGRAEVEKEMLRQKIVELQNLEKSKKDPDEMHD